MLSSDQSPPEGYLELPSYETVAEDKPAFIDMFHTFYQNNDPLTAKGLAQQHGERYLVQNPPALYPTQAELDAVYALDFERAQHPYYEQQGPVEALETIRFSIPTHRGCYGECNFCAIAVHEGRTVRWRSQASILARSRGTHPPPGFQGLYPGCGRSDGQHVRLRVREKAAQRRLRRQALPVPAHLPGTAGRSQPQMALLR